MKSELQNNQVGQILFAPCDQRSSVWNIGMNVQDVKHAQAFAAGLIPEQCQEIDAAIDQWEHELDMMGPLADRAALVAHLEKAPTGAPTADYLCEFLKRAAV